MPQIHKWKLAIAVSTNTGMPSLSVNALWNAKGQFFYMTYMQSRHPSMPWMPCLMKCNCDTLLVLAFVIFAGRLQQLHTLCNRFVKALASLVHSWLTHMEVIAEFTCCHTVCIDFHCQKQFDIQPNGLLSTAIKLAFWEKDLIVS